MEKKSPLKLLNKDILHIILNDIYLTIPILTKSNNLSLVDKFIECKNISTHFNICHHFQPNNGILYTCKYHISYHKYIIQKNIGFNYDCSRISLNRKCIEIPSSFKYNLGKTEIKWIHKEGKYIYLLNVENILINTFYIYTYQYKNRYEI